MRWNFTARCAIQIQCCGTKMQRWTDMTIQLSRLINESMVKMNAELIGFLFSLNWMNFLDSENLWNSWRYNLKQQTALYLTHFGVYFPSWPKLDFLTVILPLLPNFWLVAWMIFSSVLVFESLSPPICWLLRRFLDLFLFASSVHTFITKLKWKWKWKLYTTRETKTEWSESDAL